MYFFINFKSYRESTGTNAQKLLNGIEYTFHGSDEIIPVLNPLDSMITTGIKKFIQHADPLESGPFTGHIPVDLLNQYGYSGILLNHSEYRVSELHIAETIKLARKYELKTLLCAENLEEIKKFLLYEPDFLAYEPPSLIGGNISVSTAQPDIIMNASSIIDDRSIFIVGAGIKNRGDVELSLKYGAKGILVASGIVKSKDPISAIKEMLVK